MIEAMLQEHGGLASAESRGGTVLTESRYGVMLLLVLAIANGVFLYLAPGQAEEHYAWPLAPRASAAFLGAGYMAGVVATALVLLVARAWCEFRMLAPALFVLSVGLLGATLIHADRFRWDYAPTWVWTGVYAGVPVGLALLWRRQERGAAPAPGAHQALRGVRVASIILGCLLAIVAIALYVAPQRASDLWPWQLTALTARSLGSWYALVATALLACALMLRRPREALIPYATLGVWSALLLTLPLTHSGDVVRDGIELTVYLIATTALLALSLTALAVHVRHDRT